MHFYCLIERRIEFNIVKKVEKVPTVSFEMRSSSAIKGESKTAAISTVAGDSISVESTTGKGLKRCVEGEGVEEEDDDDESKG